MSVYVVKVCTPQSRDLWLSFDGYITEHFSHAASFASMTEATLEAMRALPYPFEVTQTTQEQIESIV